MRAVHLTLRRDLVFRRQETGGGGVFVVEEPSSGRLFRIGEGEHFIACLASLFAGPYAPRISCLSSCLAAGLGSPLAEAIGTRPTDRRPV